MPEGFTVRRATLNDLPIIVHHRLAMYTDMGTGTPESRAAMVGPSEAWLRARMERGEYLGWLAENAAGEVVAGVGLLLLDWIPGPLDVTDKRAYLLNVYTEPDYRGRGLARSLMKTALDWSREHGLRTALLHASDAGRPVYEAMGFVMSNEMRLALVPVSEPSS